MSSLNNFSLVKRKVSKFLTARAIDKWQGNSLYWLLYQQSSIIDLKTLYKDNHEYHQPLLAQASKNPVHTGSSNWKGRINTPSRMVLSFPVYSEQMRTHSWRSVNFSMLLTLEGHIIKIWALLQNKTDQ